MNVEASWTTRVPTHPERRLRARTDGRRLDGRDPRPGHVRHRYRRAARRRPRPRPTHAASARSPRSRRRLVRSVGEAVQLLPASRLGDDESARTRVRAAPPGDGRASSSLDAGPGRARARARSRRCRHGRAAALDVPGRRGRPTSAVAGDEPVLTGTPPRPRSRRRRRCHRGRSGRRRAGRRRPRPRRAGRQGRAGSVSTPSESVPPKGRWWSEAP